MSPAGNGLLETAFTRQVGIEVPLICGAMYPCTNPELVAAVSEAGGIGIIQPISLTYVYRHEFRAGVRRIRGLTSKPIGMNVLIEKASKSYYEKMTRWLDIALEEGVRFIITSLGKPDWVGQRGDGGGGRDFVAALRMGYAGVQMGTRFIATRECGASEAYKRAVVAAQEQDIVR